ncbi:hypothetical protein LTR36_006697 [Oleoguttula mirabilis]|uniref:FAD dependent oxidoreductase domain-containing protein n=1 Tax=Oleoguttula mirabilis TaxID=1507867 RepID=A0AAV9JBW1_9PEZI|nr:hypothetical protein LTR36_006697 [Oleoguttula mirabilis]
MSREHPHLPRQRQPANLPSETSTNSFWHTEPSPLLTAHRSTRNLPQTADVVVIGSGMTGASVAHHLLATSHGADSTSGSKSGLNVVMLEAREACWGATGRNGGHCQPLLFESPHDPSIGHFELANFRALQTLIKEKDIDCEFVAQPGVRAIYSQHHLDEAESALGIMKHTAPELAQMMKLVTDKEGLAKYRIPTATGAVVTEVAARMWPYKFVSRILEDLLTATDLAGTFNLQTLTPVTALAQSQPTDDDPHHHQRTWTVTTPRGAITAHKVVLATNAYTSHLLPTFADLIVPCRGQMSALKPLPSLRGEGRLATSLGFLGDGLDDYLIQRPNERGGHLMFGGGRQHGPSIGVTDDSVLDRETARYLRTRLVQALGLPERRAERACVSCTNCQSDSQHCLLPPNTRTAEFTAAAEWSGIMGFSRDERPFVGPVPAHPGLYLSAGYTGHGMPNTWLCGKAVAVMVAKGFGSQDVEAVVDAASAATGLPMAYRLTEERVRKALLAEDVEALDWAEMERGAVAGRVEEVRGDVNDFLASLQR